MKMVILVLVPVFIGVVGQLFLKQGMLQIGEFSLRSGLVAQFVKIFINPNVLVGFFFYFLSSILWLIVLSRIELSFAYPLLSVGYILILVASWFFFKENVNLIRWSGVIVICFGVYLISRS
ncbi:MAG: EamA family transporter [Candidatus Margulisbacteria bacterium]|nr:EamA family transporter [Candidatus Margulisiibacteriota bacterium]